MKMIEARGVRSEAVGKQLAVVEGEVLEGEYVRKRLLAVLRGEYNDTLAVFDDEASAQRWADRYNSVHSWSSDIDRASVFGGIFDGTDFDAAGGVAIDIFRGGARLFLAQAGEYEETMPLAVFTDELTGHRWVREHNDNNSWRTGSAARLNVETVPFNPPLTNG